MAGKPAKLLRLLWTRSKLSWLLLFVAVATPAAHYLAQRAGSVPPSPLALDFALPGDIFSDVLALNVMTGACFFGRELSISLSQ